MTFDGDTSSTNKFARGSEEELVTTTLKDSEALSVPCELLLVVKGAPHYTLDSKIVASDD